jgi:hypothetical protein
MRPHFFEADQLQLIDIFLIASDQVQELLHFLSSSQDQSHVFVQSRLAFDARVGPFLSRLVECFPQLLLVETDLVRPVEVRKCVRRLSGFWTEGKLRTFTNEEFLAVCLDEIGRVWGLIPASNEANLRS